MKKVIFLWLSVISCAHLSASITLKKVKAQAKNHVQADRHYPHVYYNAQKFPQGLFNKEGKSLLPKLCFTNALIAWDLNGVIFKKEYYLPSLMYQLAVTEKYGWFFTFKAFTAFTKLMRHKQQLKQSNDPRGWVFDAMFQTLETSSAQEQRYAQLLRKFTEQVNVLNYQTVELIKELTTNGHTSVILSNMGQGLVDALINSLTRKLEKRTAGPKKREAINFIIEFLSDSQRHVIASAKNNWLHKPLRKSYRTCLNKNQSNDKQLKIILDDKLSNITAGLAEGLFDIGILFTTAQEVRTSLAYLSNGKLVLK